MIEDSIFEMRSDFITPTTRLNKKLQVIINREFWTANNAPVSFDELDRFTDGSKASVGMGAGIDGIRSRMDLRYSTVFQAEVFAIPKCIEETMKIT